MTIYSCLSLAFFAPLRAQPNSLRLKLKTEELIDKAKPCLSLAFFAPLRATSIDQGLTLPTALANCLLF